MRDLIKKCVDGIDLFDVFTFGGLACIGYGLHAVYPPAAWIVVGSALFWIGTH